VVPEGMVARRNGNAWTVIEDHRRDVLYVVATGQQYSIGSHVEAGGDTLVYGRGRRSARMVD